MLRINLLYKKKIKKIKKKITYTDRKFISKLFFLCVNSCLPFSSSEFLGSLGVNSHGPVHAAGEAFLQQEFCNVAILPQRKTENNMTKRVNLNATSTAD